MRRRSSLSLLALVSLSLAAGACGGSASGPIPEDLPERGVFIAAYVDLRVAALTSGSGEISDDARDEVLARHAVTEEQLVSFVDYHGEDLDFMRDVWNEIELLLDAQRPTIDEAVDGND